MTIQFNDLTRTQKETYLMQLINCQTIDYLIDKGFLPEIISHDVY